MSIPNSEEDPVVQFQQDGPSDEEIRLRALKQTKDRLMSIVGHYLRTAVGGVRSLTSMLERRLEKGDIEDAQRLSGLLRRSALDADDLLKDLPPSARSTHEEHHFKLESLDLQGVIQAEADRLQSTAMQKNQQIILDTKDSGMVRADPFMLSAILRNLIGNALKFFYAGGKITIRTKREPGHWLINVSDRGIGMSEEIQALLLKIDKRKQQTGPKGEKGSGFGLLRCEDFVARHSGHLTWVSSPGEGSTFSFTIPELFG